MNKFLDSDITNLNLNKKINDLLKENNIIKINEIIIKLELNGLDLNKKTNK